MKDLNVKNVAIMGMGYVGLTLSVVLAKNGLKTYGIEIDKSVVNDLKNGKPHFEEKGLEILLKYEQKIGNLKIHDKLPESDIDAYIISVGTPLLNNSKKPNIKYIEQVVIDVAKNMSKGSIVILRSTVPVGLSRDTVIPLLENYSGLSVGDDFSFAFAPERTVEGKAIIELEQNPQIIGGYDSKSTNICANLFRRITHTIVSVSSIEAAEMIKIMDNSYRDIRFAYANEIALISEKIGLDMGELVHAANIHYPRNNIPIPSPGVGGACLSKDPHILSYFAQKYGYNPKLIREGRNINEYIPIQIVERLRDHLLSMELDISTAKFFILGFAFKGNPETSDMRDSTTIWFLDELKKYNNNIYGYDALIHKSKIEELGIKFLDTEEGFSDSDVVLFMNNHPSFSDLDPYKICEKMNKPGIVYDAWRMFRKDIFDDIDGITYMGVGV